MWLLEMIFGVLEIFDWAMGDYDFGKKKLQRRERYGEERRRELSMDYLDKPRNLLR